MGIISYDIAIWFLFVLIGRKILTDGVSTPIIDESTIDSLVGGRRVIRRKSSQGSFGKRIQTPLIRSLTIMMMMMINR